MIDFSQICGNDAKWDGDGLSYTALFGSYLLSDSYQIFLHSEMLATPLTCTYDPKVDADISIDTIAGGKATIQSAEGSLEISTTISTKGDRGVFTELTKERGVTLGELIKVTFTASSRFMPIHIQSCVAQDKATGEEHTVDLIVDDCYQSGSYALDQGSINFDFLMVSQVEILVSLLLESIKMIFHANYGLFYRPQRKRVRTNFSL